MRTPITENTRAVLAAVSGLGRSVTIGGNVAFACLLLVARIWLSQAIFVHQVMMIMLAPGALEAPQIETMLIRSVVPLLLATGLLTRPVALFLALSGGFENVGVQLTGPRALLLIWLLAQGAGPLSIDLLLRRGAARMPIWAVRAISRLYVRIDRWADVALPFATRVYLALYIAAETGALLTTSWWILPLCWALVFGMATRIVAPALCMVAPPIILSAGTPDRFDVMLLLLLVAGKGAGPLSFDGLAGRWAEGRLHSQGHAGDAMPHVVVVGGGFGGIATVRALRWTACRITLVDRRNHYLFQPLLYQVATAALSPADIAIPIRSVLRGQRNVSVRLGEVVGVDSGAREVVLSGGRIPFDYLVLATGAQHSYFGRDEWSAHAPGLKSIEDATAIRSRMLRAFERAESETDPAVQFAWLTFIVVGGGPTGVELAGALAEFARTGLGQEYQVIDPGTARVILVQSAPRVLPTFSPSLSVQAEQSLRELGVEVRTRARVTHIDHDGVDVDGECIAARTVLWAAGVAASAAATWLGQAGDKSGRVIVDADLSVPGLPGVFAIGDTAASNGWAGAAVPGLAPAAKQQGRYVARAIRATLKERPVTAFRYVHYGNLATIGRLAAVVEVQRFRLWGAPAWWFWGIAHVLLLGGGRNRVSVVLNWLWAYLTYRRSTRLITGGDLDSWPVGSAQFGNSTPHSAISSGANL